MDERRRLLVLIAATAGATLIPLNTSMLTVALPPIARAFDVTLTTSAWLMLLYLTVMTSLQPVAGKLGDRFGHAAVFQLGLLLFTAASVGAALAPTYPMLVIMRALQALGGSSLGPNATALIRLAYPPERQGQAMGLYVGVFSLGLTLGPVVSGFLVSSLGWQAVFWINLVIAFPAGWMGWRALPRGTGGQPLTFDWWGAGLFTTIIGAVVIALNLWKEGGLPFPLWPVLGGALLAGVLLIKVEERVPDPLIRPSLFRLPGFGAGTGAIFLIHTIQYVMLMAVPFILQQGRGFSAVESGLVMALYAGLQALLAPFAGRLSDRVGRKAVATASGVLFAAGAILLWLLPPAGSMLWFLGAVALTGAATGLAAAPVQAASLAACPRDLVGIASGVWYSSRYLGNIAGGLLTSLLLPRDLTSGASALYAAVTVTALLLTGSARLLPGETEIAEEPAQEAAAASGES